MAGRQHTPPGRPGPSGATLTNGNSTNDPKTKINKKMISKPRDTPIRRSRLFLPPAIETGHEVGHAGHVRRDLAAPPGRRDPMEPVQVSQASTDGGGGCRQGRVRREAAGRQRRE